MVWLLARNFWPRMFLPCACTGMRVKTRALRRSLLAVVSIIILYIVQWGRVRVNCAGLESAQRSRPRKCVENWPAWVLWQDCLGDMCVLFPAAGRAALEKTPPETLRARMDLIGH